MQVIITESPRRDAGLGPLKRCCVLVVDLDEFVDPFPHQPGRGEAGAPHKCEGDDLFAPARSYSCSKEGTASPRFSRALVSRRQRVSRGNSVWIGEPIRHVGLGLGRM